MRIFNKPLSLMLAFCIGYAAPVGAQHKKNFYGEKICHDKGFHCLTVKRQDRWGTLFPDPKIRDLVKRINRTNVFLKPKMIIAVPDNIEKQTLFTLSPFKLHIESTNNQKLIIVDQKLLAFAIYNEFGQLLRWGPISAGSDHCFESDSCKTPEGTFTITRKKGEDCYSNSLPLITDEERGGAFMPYCMFFDAGYALHGSDSIPGYNASHGCVRMFIEDAKWLYNYIDMPSKDNPGTKVSILPSQSQ